MDLIPPPLPTSLQRGPRKKSTSSASSALSSSSSDGGGSDRMTDVDDRPREERLASAASLREAGNSKLKAGDLAGAVKDYTRGIADLKEIEFSPSAEADLHKQTRDHKLALNLNLALAHTKLAQWSEASQAAVRALDLDPANTKGLFRRGLAKARLGFYDEARSDLLAVLKVEPSNAAARQELESVKQKDRACRAAEKAAFGSLFAKAGGLYDDREKQVQEEKRKAAEREKQERQLWEEDMKERKRKGDSEIDFDSWREEVKRKREAEEKKRLQEEKKEQRSSGTKKKPGPAIVTDSSTGLELDEEDLKVVGETKKMGYCYFRTQLDEETKSKLQAANKPQPLDASQLSPADSAGPGSSKSSQAISQWNKEGGTYEEKDVTSWVLAAARKAFETVSITTTPPEGAEGLVEALQNSGTSEADMAAAVARDHLLENELRITSADVTGTAEVVVVRGSRRYLYDLSVKLNWEWRVPPRKDCRLGRVLKAGNCALPEEETKKTGTLTLADVDAAGTHSGEWARQPPLPKVAKNALLTAVLGCAMSELPQRLLQAARAFEEEYHKAH